MLVGSGLLSFVETRNHAQTSGFGWVARVGGWVSALVAFRVVFFLFKIMSNLYEYWEEEVGC